MTRGNSIPFSILALPLGALQSPGGKVMELEDAERTATRFHSRPVFPNGKASTVSVWRGDARHIRQKARSGKNSVSGGERYADRLANRNKLHSRLEATLADAKARQCEVALLMMDLDKFKQINDTLGHACGDQLLRGSRRAAEYAGRWRRAGGPLSGDEFAVVISGADAVAKAKTLSERMSLRSARLRCLSARARSTSMSASERRLIQGLPDGRGASRQRRPALYQAKAPGGRCVFFERSIRDRLGVAIVA